mmetsp:Transcript_28692/g.60124  ORF Transcript_28692/g.60124 Transcript_28692/m.60124 type:complete len:708 (+) Transcript_28692:95-2218(+)
MSFLINFNSGRILLLSGLGLLLLMVHVEGLSSSSPHRRPPRIRPRRQSPTPSFDNDSIIANRYDEKNSNTNTINKEEIRVRRHEQALQDPSLLTTVRFSDRSDIHRDTREALVEGFGLQAMTQVQAMTYEAALSGRSILARSRTGTGKTLAFLLPAIERLLAADLDFYQPGRSIGCIILAPTRELAIQIADQAEILFDFHNKHRHGNRQLSVACIYGGVKMQRDVRLLTGEYRGRGRGDLPTILVATPARLLEHLEGNSPLNKNNKSNRNHLQQHRSKNSFADIVAKTKIVVLDETDRLLQKSNQYETQRILSFMARAEKRQTLLFSATIPRAVRRLISTSSILNKKMKQSDGRCDGRDDVGNFLEVDCIGNGDNRVGDMASITDTPSAEATLNTKEELSSASTNRQRIEESFVVLENMSQFIPTLLTIVRREKQRDGQNYKILVFFPAGRMVRFLFQFFTIGGIETKNNIWEIHSRMSQSSRTRASSAFRNARNGILFSSDVSARGLDYPDISLVVQMGAPSNDRDYIHRIGRTGRAGQEGRSLLVLLPFEEQKKERYQQKGKKRRSGKGSYRNESNIKQDRQLVLWLGAQNEYEEDNNQETSTKSLYQECQDDLESTRLKVRSGHVVLTPGAEAAYKTFLAHYIATINAPNRTKKGTKKNVSKDKPGNELQPSKILAFAEDFAKGTGLADIPDLEEEFLSKLGVQ